MELVSVIAGEQWTDAPQCVHPVLRDLAIFVNDSLSDADRHLLMPLVGRFFGTNLRGADSPLAEYRDGQQLTIRASASSVPYAYGCGCPACQSNWVKQPLALVAMLSRALDIADKYRVEPVRRITPTDVKRVRERLPV
jgi:hypothetical protein